MKILFIANTTNFFISKYNKHKKLKEDNFTYNFSLQAT